MQPEISTLNYEEEKQLFEKTGEEEAKWERKRKNYENRTEIKIQIHNIQLKNYWNQFSKKLKITLANTFSTTKI